MNPQEAICLGPCQLMTAAANLCADGVCRACYGLPMVATTLEEFVSNAVAEVQAIELHGMKELTCGITESETWAGFPISTPTTPDEIAEEQCILNGDGSGAMPRGIITYPTASGMLSPTKDSPPTINGINIPELMESVEKQYCGQAMSILSPVLDPYGRVHISDESVKRIAAEVARMLTENPQD